MCSAEGWDWVCFFGLRGPCGGSCASSLEKTALSASVGSTLWEECLLGDAPAWLPLWCTRLPFGRRPCRPLLVCGAGAVGPCWGCWCLPRGARGDAVPCALDM